MSVLPSRILLATDGSENADLVTRAAVDITHGSKSELHVVHVWPGPPIPVSRSYVKTGLKDPLHDQREREARELLRKQVWRAGVAGGTVAGRYLREGRPAEEIAALAREIGADFVVVGSRGLGPVERLVRGSVSEGVIDLVSCAVLVVRGGHAWWPPSRVVVGDDSSRGAKKAVEVAAGIAGLFGARMLLVRAHPVILGISDAAKVAEQEPVPLHTALCRHEISLERRARAVEAVLGHRPKIRVREGEAASVILEAAEEGGEPTLIAVGRRGLGRLDRLRLGSVSTKVLRAASGPVLISPS
jgi:nucleotide-binding universal stress UspA family protein